MTGTVNVCIAMGSNMGDRLKHLQMASEQLGDLPDTTLTACSQWLETDPVGPIEQGAFLNGAAVIQTKLSAGDLLAKLNAICGRPTAEILKQPGRRRNSVRHAARMRAQ